MIELDIKKKLLGAQGEFTLDVKLHIEQGEFVTLFGESGAGKTTLLRCLAGLAEPDAGSISVNGETWFDSRTQTCRCSNAASATCSRTTRCSPT